MKNKFKACLKALISPAFIGSFAIATPAHAQFGKFKDLVDSSVGNNSGLMSRKELKAGYSEITSNFVYTSQNMLRAHSITLEALGKKEEAAKYSQYADSMTLGDCKSTCVKNTIIVSQEANSEAQSALETSETLSEESKSILASAVDPYLQGTLSAVKLPKQYSSWVNNAKDTMQGAKSNPLAIRKLISIGQQIPQAVEVTTELPGLINQWQKTTRNFNRVATQAGIDTKEIDASLDEEF